MKNTKSTKRALLSAILALVMTVSMLVGTTFAWFTDSVTSSGNKIVAGELDVELHMFNAKNGAYENISDAEYPIFGAGGLVDTQEDVSTIWEPGKTQVVYLAIKNAGDLDLKYKVVLDVTEITKNLNKVLSFTITPDAKAGDVTAWNGADAKSVDAGEQVVSAPNVALEAEATHYFALSIHMDELAGNEYMNGSITFDLSVLAAQLASEDDSFGSDFDKDATYTDINKDKVTDEDFAENDEVTIQAGGATVTLPEELGAGEYELVLDNHAVKTDEATNETTVSFDLTLSKDGVKFDEATPGVKFPVSINVGKYLNITSVTHKGAPVTAYSYDKETGILSFETDSFSPFAITYYEGSISSDATAEDMNALISKGGEFTLTENLVLDSALVIPEGAEVLLNLNGKSIVIEAAYDDANYVASSAIANYGTLTISGAGSIKASNNYTVRNNGVMIIDGATIENGIMNFNNLTVESGNISNSRSGKHTIYGNNAKLTINGGNFYNGNPGNAAIFAYGGEVVINDGDFSIADGTSTLGWTSCLIDAQGGAKYVINGGVIRGEIRDYGKNTAIKGGIFYHSSVNNFLAEDCVSIKNSDGTWTVYAPGATITLPAGATLDLGGKAFNGTIKALGDLTIKGDTTIKTLSAVNGGTITIEDGKTLNLNSFSFGSKATAGNEYVIKGGTIIANYGFFQHGTYALYSNFETGYMYYSFGSDITLYGTFHSKGLGDGLDYIRGTLTVADGGKSIHDKSLWVGQPASWGAMEATLIVENGGFVSAGALSVYAGSELLVAPGATVEAKSLNVEGESYVYVKTADELLAALEDGEDVCFANDITVAAGLSNAYGATAINVLYGQTIDGNGYTLKVTGANGTWDSAISTTGGTIKNLTIAGGFRGVFVNHNSTEHSKVILDNVIISGPTYAINCDQGTNSGLEVKNSFIYGWTSFADTVGEVTFTNCEFDFGSGYGVVVPYIDATFVGCKFGDGFGILNDEAKVTLVDCYYNGDKLITAENVDGIFSAAKQYPEYYTPANMTVVNK